NSEGGPPGGVPSGLQRKAPLDAGLKLKGESRSLFTLGLVAVAAIDIDVGGAHIAASHWAVPFIRLGRVSGICSRSNGIGLPTRARREGRTTGIDRRGSATSAIGPPSRAIGSTGISSRRAIGWRRGVGWCPRSVPLAHITRVDVRVDIGLCVRRHHPGG